MGGRHGHLRRQCAAARQSHPSPLNERQHLAEAVVPDHQLSLAIGKEGQNVRLAARLTGWRIDIHNEEQWTKVVSQRVEEEQGRLRSSPRWPKSPRKSPAST